MVYRFNSFYRTRRLFTFGTSREGAYLGRGSYFFFEKQQNIQNQSLIRYKKGAKSNQPLRGAKEIAWRAHTFSQSLREKKHTANSLRLMGG